ncbi:Holliday junction branch migration DNA helicase RuvB [Sphingomonas sp. 3-13AW]|uniref:Holliday junction branch migration DNA helicase RuvB n=1 Tax=Sphingomonas sp. 3-13AW TaxID=3050450 RepID=UPI003BB7644D
MTTVRPKDIDGFVGQAEAVANLAVFTTAARARSEPLDHILFHGPPGLGKTTLAGIVACQMGAKLHTATAPALSRVSDIIALLMGLNDGDVLFMDEIHRLPIEIEETLYGALEDRKVDLLVGEGLEQRPVTMDLPRFTFVGATTRIGAISKPLFDRFGIEVRLQFYADAELAEIVRRQAVAGSVEISDDACLAIGRRARGTPRIAGRLFRRVRDFADVAGDDLIEAVRVNEALERMNVDAIGLDWSDARYLKILATHYGGGPAGVETLAVALSEPRDTLEDVIEPFLIRQGLIARTGRGRVLTEAGWRHTGLQPPEKEAA